MFRILLFCILHLVSQSFECSAQPTYNFTEFKFRGSRKARENRTVTKLERRCKHTCSGWFPDMITGEFSMCQKKCVASKAEAMDCFNTLYRDDPLEDGEVDVRLRSFRACVAMTMKENKSATRITQSINKEEFRRDEL
eukprot:m.18250 g.18250  ORF g.18250 m.18250 type:complete len:138 (-) comp6254_c0_seq1:1441-1854(-)